MALSAANVRVGTTGSIHTAPQGTALPTGTQTTLNVAFIDLGYVTEAGVIESNSKSTSKIKAWQNGDVIRVLQSEDSVTFKFACMETSANVMKTYYGNYTAGKIEVNGLTLPQQPFILDVVDGLDLVRVVIPFGQVTERGDITWSNGDATSYDMTIEAFPDPNYSGSLAAAAKAYKYLYDVSGGVSA